MQIFIYMLTFTKLFWFRSELVGDAHTCAALTCSNKSECIYIHDDTHTCRDV